MFHAKVKLVTLFFARQRKNVSALAGVSRLGHFFCSVYSGLGSAAIPVPRLAVFAVGFRLVVLLRPRASLRSAFLISSPTMLFIECPF